ncbi:Macrolide export ATP-binding/permease protein MacB [Acholeplasma oculi]|uniref:ABC transporter, permease/ATP-binding protein n=1 Tax=Acholeplasma oculi TaxID=35623 RepID=A0A061AKF7_9MOLU|nr:ABC transporter ATP-binding protein/permease [Acholeplasma oculi]CDR31517.1 ABC transporter, permease/ATP-binding protein [Acholeplasma oculi]SKC49589.1 putative ABC transport system permease protein [Acholeplasma oculi]SUT92329.1 Macrolide export ATP-binding/permease protein MacB [Acholeplasma oculi]
MLEIKDLKKHYIIGEQTFTALNSINLNFRKHEFVAILGQSGSGKTTLLNLIGGLDRYTSGDIIIDNVSTKNYKDKDWDAYRNHRIGFVFQNYNLIAHLDVLSNVELAQTLSGVSKEERKRRAIEVLTRVGLKDHMKKKPNQLSGGQQQRVSIARALINNPSIILADEPTGALDSETSVDIMNLLTEISEDKLIIMVTHNGELAKKYANRIVTLKDGLVTSDSNPFEVKRKDRLENTVSKSSMSYLTALSLSFKNMLTKKVRTLITALAGSIGIIGVALVMSLQYGFTDYLNNMERGTFAGLPLQVSRSYIDISDIMMSNRQQLNPLPPIEGGVLGYEPEVSRGLSTNDISEEYIEYLETSDLNQYGSIVYQYGFTGQYYYMAGDTLYTNPRSQGSLGSSGRSYVTQSAYAYEFVNDFFDVVHGTYYNVDAHEALLVVNREHKLPKEILTFLGLPTDQVVPFEDIVGKEFKVYTNNAYYTYNGTQYVPKNTTNNLEDLKTIYNSNSSDVITVRIAGIVKTNTNLVQVNESIIYTPLVATDVLAKNNVSDVVVAQRASETSVIQGVVFNPLKDKEDVLYELGGIDLPNTILIYPNSFDDKANIVEILDAYNEGLDEDDQINYTDNVAVAVSMIKTVMDSVSAVLVAFASISLFVSSVMIGIITYTSVLERTKEIGVLRSIGARKKDISRVFNAEAILIGFVAGLLGVMITYAIIPVINIFLEEPTGNSNIANLFYLHAILLVVISITLTFIAGLIPSRIAAKKDPVVALRSE